MYIKVGDFCVRMCNKFWAVMGLFVTLNIVGAGLFILLEAQPVTYVHALYWSFITSLSVGYGDISPESTAGMILAVALAWTVLLFIVPLLVTVFAGKVIKNIHELTDQEQKRWEAKLDALPIAQGIDPTTITGE